ncbi:RNA polymerase sigma factor [Metabacillus malikii]|uniref:RNA polymerase sigma-70 factor (ECF subfamily) n=1 Tax=Metabacillus malikii TaxID=1504265 RepID=A0ABT9ZK21_9BACI|nr:sigma-70 family RNA polymerase sigma factor [Metabacillus malikii]MDQ0232644.1 RNA polymerase sigma-70 factor (ECF subfamily) [Metabacillus malikii]
MNRDKNKAIIAWYEEFNESIFKFIFMMVQDYQLAEDLRHETFIKAFVHYDSFREESSPKTWLYSIAHNVTVDCLRKRKPIILLKNTFQLHKDPSKLPHEHLELKEDLNELYHVLSALKESHRKVIILRKIKEFSIEETALILGWSESKVKSTLYRAIQRLEKDMLKEGYFNEKTV